MAEQARYRGFHQAAKHDLLSAWKTMGLTLRAFVVELVADADPSKRWKDYWLEVVDLSTAATDEKPWARCVARFCFMRDAILTSIEVADGMNPHALRAIHRVETGEALTAETTGNGWVAHISRDKVWFEGLHGQGAGGEVSSNQYRLAVETFIRFLADPEHKTIAVPFPEN